MSGLPPVPTVVRTFLIVIGVLVVLDRYGVALKRRAVSELQALERLRRTVRTNRARKPPGYPQRLPRYVAMWCDAQRRVVERCDAPRRAANQSVGYPPRVELSGGELAEFSGSLIIKTQFPTGS